MRRTTLRPPRIKIWQERSGVFSARVVGLPIYAAADTRQQAQRAIRQLLVAYNESKAKQ